MGLLPIWIGLDAQDGVGLDALARVMAPLALLGGFWGDLRQKPLLGPRLATAISIALFAGYALQIDRQNLVNPVLNLAVLLLAVRLLTAKQGRHFLQIFLLAGFMLAGSTLVSLSLLFLPAMVLLVFGIIFGLVLLCFLQADPQLRLDRRRYRLLLRSMLLLPSGALLLALLFFFILPRTERPLWGFLNPSQLAGGVGFSDKVQPGSVSSTAADNRIAFRAESPELAPEDLYWRGTVLDSIDAGSWIREELATPEPPLVAGGRPLTLTLYPAVETGQVLITLDVPRHISARQRLRTYSDGVYALSAGGKRPRGYRVDAAIGGRLREPSTAAERWLTLPDDFAPRGRQVAAGIAAKGGDRQTRLRAVADFFRQQQLVYATSNLPTSGDPVDTFLFEEKRGYCEHFAAAFATLLRAAGVPARLVGGYYGGDYNPLGGYYLVGERAAHVWVEALLDDGHWQRYDPNRLAARFESGLLSGQAPLPGWRQIADAIDYYWVQAVVTLDFARQLETAVALRELYYRHQAWWWTGISLLVTVGGLVLAWRRRHRQPRTNRGDRLARVFIARLEKRLGRERRIDEGLQSLAEASGESAARDFARIYTAALYGDRRLSTAERKQLQTLLRQLR